MLVQVSSYRILDVKMIVNPVSCETLTNSIFVPEIENKYTNTSLNGFYDEFVVSFLMLSNGNSIQSIIYIANDNEKLVDLTITSSSYLDMITLDNTYQIKTTANTWSSIEISQYFINNTYNITAAVNGSVQYSNTNTQPMVFTDVIFVYTFYECSFHPNDCYYGSIKNLSIYSKTQVIWLQWSEWSQCNEFLVKTRTRNCSNNQWLNCIGNSSDVTSCSNPECFIMENETQLVHGNLLTTLKKLSKEYSLYFEIKPTAFQFDWGNVIHLTTGEKQGTYGAQNPIVLSCHKNACLNPGSLKIGFVLNGNMDRFIYTNPVGLGVWSSLKIMQKYMQGKYMYTIELNGENIFNEENTDARELSNVKVYISSIWHEVQPGLIRNLKITNDMPETKYRISVKTGDLLDSGTYANIYLILFGQNVSSDELELKESLTNKIKFERGNTDVFSFSMLSLGILTKLRVWHDNTNDLPGWFLSYIEVFDGSNNETFMFPCERWLAKDEGDGSIVRELATNSNETKKISSMIDFKNCTTLIPCFCTNGSCVNMNGRFICLCADGWRLGKDNASCLEIDQWSEWGQICTDLYWTKSVKNITNLACNSLDIATNILGGCNATCGNEVINRMQEYCKFSAKKNGFCGDSLYMFGMIAQQPGNHISTLNVFYDEFVVTFELNIWKASLDEGNIFQLSNNSTGDVYFLFELLGSSSGQNYSGFFTDRFSETQIFVSSLTLTNNTWTSIKISQQYLNSIYYRNITVNGIVVFSTNNFQPIVIDNIDIYACHGYCQSGSIRNLVINSKTQVCWSSWGSWSNCGTSNVLYRTRNCSSNEWLKCNGNSIEIQNCNEKLWNVSNIVTINGNLVTLFLQINPNFRLSSNVSVELEYFLSPFLSLVSSSVIPGFFGVANRLMYAFNRTFNSSNSFSYSFTATFNNSICPMSGMITLEIPLMVSLQVDFGKPMKFTKTAQKTVQCLNIPKISVVKDKQILDESYGRGIYWDADNSHVYVCMNQHVPSEVNACYYSDNNGELWDSIDVRIGSIIGHNFLTKELFGIHRNRKVYMFYHKEQKKWLAMTNQQFKEISNFNNRMFKSLEGDYDQIVNLGTNQWFGNAEGLFFRKQVNDSWIKRVKWRFCMG